FVGVLFKTVLYRVEDLCDKLWRGRPEWLRPGVGGILLGLVLLAVPQLYGVGYPVMGRALSGGYVLWFLLLLAAGKMVASSLTIGIGGSGGVFAPSLFVGASFGMAYGVLVHHVFGAAAGPEAAYGLVAMGAVFAGGTRAPLTASASVLEMSGDFGMVLPVMLGTALASAVSARLGRGTIYTTKLLRRGIDIERPKTGAILRLLTVADAMAPLPGRAAPESIGHRAAVVAMRGGADAGEGELQGRPPGTLAPEETIEDALADLVRFGREGLPVLGDDGRSVVGWVTDRDVLRTLARRLGRPVAEGDLGTLTLPGGGAALSHDFPPPGYRLLELTVPTGREGRRRIRDLVLPPATLVVGVRRGEEAFPPGGDSELRAGDRLTVLTAPEQVHGVRTAIAVDHPGGEQEV
ncbi:MAG: chloride channel protein, partial [Candidatus Dormibacteraeota bacterium]|nr:chloride channel protein [Candidatus Dormibacteraeota bacterium]